MSKLKKEDKRKVLAVLIAQERLIQKLVKKVDDKKTLGKLLTDIVDTNRNLMTLLDSGEPINPAYIQAATLFLAEVLKSVIRRWF